MESIKLKALIKCLLVAGLSIPSGICGIVSGPSARSVSAHENAKHRRSARPKFAPYSKETLDKCEAASNCEVYETKRGNEIRFKPGMNLARRAANHNLDSVMRGLEARQETYHTNVSIGDNSVIWGGTDPATTIGILTTLCSDTATACDSTPYAQAINWVDPSNANGLGDANLMITATGEYADESEQLAFIRGIEATLSQSTQWTNESYIVTSGERCDSCWESQTYSFEQATQSDFIGMSRFDSDNNLAGFMNVQLTFEDLEGDGTEWCQILAGGAASIEGAVSGVGGAILGLISALCAI